MAGASECSKLGIGANISRLIEKTSSKIEKYYNAVFNNGNNFNKNMFLIEEVPIRKHFVLGILKHKELFDPEAYEDLMAKTKKTMTPSEFAELEKEIELIEQQRKARNRKEM